MNKIEIIDKYSGYMDRFLERFSLFMIFVSVLFSFISVILRYIFGMSFEILSEISTYSIVFGVFAYFGPLIKQDEHIKMGLIHDLFKGKKILNYLDLFISIFLLLAFTFLLYGGINWAESLFEMQSKTLSGELILFIPAMSIVIGMFLGLVYSVLEIIKDISKIRKK